MITHRDTPGLPEYVKGDTLRLRQILVNLIGNSIKFSEQGAVTVKVVLDVREKKRGKTPFYSERYSHWNPSR